MGRIRIKRFYETAADDDGFRVLVDRVWLEQIAPSRAAATSVMGNPERVPIVSFRLMKG